MSAGAVTRLRVGGNSRIPADGYVLSGSGDAADFLERTAPVGSVPAVDLGLRTGSGPLAAGSWDSILGGGPRLIQRGRLRVRTVPEGFLASFAARNPRTLARADPRRQAPDRDRRRPSVGLQRGGDPGRGGARDARAGCPRGA